ncbi:MAG: HTH domain-containing protein [Pseudomonadota bacterium]
MRHGDRLFEVIEVQCNAYSPISSEGIRRQLSVTTRTVYRDAAAWAAQGAPIQDQAGFGYVPQAGFNLPLLMLPTDEVKAATFGAEWVQTRGDPALAKAAAGLITKFEVVVPERLCVSFFEPIPRMPRLHSPCNSTNSNGAHPRKAPAGNSARQGWNRSLLDCTCAPQAEACARTIQSVSDIAA